ncbi:MAG: helix-turn-helix domain-containing protein [Bacteroidota bacterium]
MYPYVEHRSVWSQWIVKGIYLHWLIYLLQSAQFIIPSLRKLPQRKQLTDIDIWWLSIYFGVALVWLAYSIGAYTSYIVGAISFSFILYLIVLLLVFRRLGSNTFFEKKQKYKNKQIKDELLEKLDSGLSKIVEKELFLDPNISLSKTASELAVPRHILSQYLNENLGKSFSTYINELRVEKAKEFLETNTSFTIESIGYESGFNSKSTFFSSFKRITGQTPAEYLRKAE